MMENIPDSWGPGGLWFKWCSPMGRVLGFTLHPVQLIYKFLPFFMSDKIRNLLRLEMPGLQNDLKVHIKLQIPFTGLFLITTLWLVMYRILACMLSNHRSGFICTASATMHAKRTKTVSILMLVFWTFTLSRFIVCMYLYKIYLSYSRMSQLFTDIVIIWTWSVCCEKQQNPW
jgi:hypothetical protein